MKKEERCRLAADICILSAKAATKVFIIPKGKHDFN
jgi:hypothetical protein